MDCMEVITASQLSELTFSFILFSVGMMLFITVPIWEEAFDRFLRYIRPRAIARRRVRVDGKLKKYLEYPAGYLRDLAFEVENDSAQLESLADELVSLAEKARADGFDYVAEQLNEKAAESRFLAVDAREAVAFRCARLEKGKA